MNPGELSQTIPFVHRKTKKILQKLIFYPNKTNGCPATKSISVEIRVIIEQTELLSSSINS